MYMLARHGVDNVSGPRMPPLRPPIDAIEEFQLLAGNCRLRHRPPPIAFGANEFHGLAWKFFGNDKLDADSDPGYPIRNKDN
jgi:hypothetical protein